MNEQLKLIRENEKELKIAMQQNARYQSLHLEKEEAKQKAAECESKLEKTKGKFQVIEELLRKWPLFTERIRIKQRLKEFAPHSFPTDGLRRYEKYADRLIELSSRVKAIQDRMEQTRKSLEEKAPLKSLEPMIMKAENLISEWPRVSQLSKEIAELKQKIEENDQRVGDIGRELHYPKENISNVRLINLGIDMKGRIRETLQKSARFESHLEELQSQTKLVLTELKQIEEKCHEIESQLLSEEDFRLLQQQQEDWRSTEQLPD